MSDIPDRRGLETLSTWVSGVTSHVGIEVPDLDEARRFYCDILGFAEAWGIEFEGPAPRAAIGDSWREREDDSDHRSRRGPDRAPAVFASRHNRQERSEQPRP